VYALLRQALALKRRAAVSVAAVAAMALLALAAIAISDSNERTELAYRSSLDPTMNPAISTGHVRFNDAGGNTEVLQKMALWEQQAATAERNLQASISRAASLALVQFRV
jgi:hypothetical protein